MKAILIARVSTEEQREAGNSLPAQIARLQKYCASKNFIIQQTYSFDESAYKQDRTEFDSIMDTILTHKEKIAICCDKVDRLTRNMFDKRISLLYEKALKDELELHFISDGQILNSKLSAAEKFQFSISLGLAKYYSDAVSDNVKRAIEQKLRQGEWIAKAPYGYKNVKTATGHSNLVVDDFAATIVKQLFELYVTRLYSVQTLTAKAKTDYGLVWDPSFTAKILQRHFYYGHMEVNKQLYPHKYPPLISKELFDQVKALKDNFNKKKQQYKTTGIEFLYRGLLRCAECDLTITPEHQKGFAYYHCNEYYGKHGAKWLREEKITEAIEQVFKQLQMPEDIAEQITAMLNEQYEHQAKFHSQHLARIEQEQKTLQRMKENLYVDRLKGRITEHEYDNFFKKLEEEQLNINHRLQKLQDADANYYVTSAQIISLTSQAHDLFKGSEVNEKRHLIKFLLQNLQISGENVLYELKKPFDLLLNCSEEVRWRP